VHAIIVRWQIKPECVEEFEKAMKEHIAATRRTEPGCLQFDVAVDNESPRTYHLFEVYRDDEALARHAKSPTLAGIRAHAAEWLESRIYARATLWPAIGASD